MTRNEFIDNITEWYELKDFCSDFDCDVCEDIYDDDDYDDSVEEDIRDAIADYGWRDIRDFLGNLPSGYYYYRRNSAFDYDGLDDDDFEDYKEDVLEWGDDYGAWDDEEEEDEEYADADDDFLDSLEEEPDEDETIEEEDFSIDDLIGMCSVVFVAIQNDEVGKQQEEDEAFAQLLSMDGRRIAT
jgi:hypothetical protein